MKKSGTVLYATILIIGYALCIAAAPVSGETPPLWSGLEPGPFGVGFKTIETIDYSRSFQAEVDYFGAPIPGEPGRPVQVCYWYPALPGGGTAMVYSEYAFPYPANSRLFSMLSNLQMRELNMIFAFMRNNQALVSEVMNYPLMAVRDAAPASGKFPLIVYHGSERGAYSQNAAMCEYLASHGFVVATTHTVGAADFNITDQPADIEAAVRDKELAVAAMHELPFVDIQKLGLIGYNYGITTSLIHQMRNYSVDAVASLQGRFMMNTGGAALIRNASYNPTRMRTPWLLLYPDSAGQTAELNLADTLRYCTRYLVKMPQVRPTEFSFYGLMAAVSGADTARTVEAAGKAQGSLGLYLWRFFDACLNDNATSRDWLADKPEANGLAGREIVVTIRPADGLTPTADQFQGIIQTYGVAKAKELCDKFGFPTVENPVLADAVFTRLGYQSLQSGDLPSALQIFAWGVTAYPGSANAWDSYGEACATSGDPVTALANYRKALETLASDTMIDPNMKTQLETSIPANIQRLEQEVAARGNTGGGSK
jgi:hypothetical protein